MADPTWLPDVLRAAGLTCDVYSGAMQRGHGDFGSIWGVIAHHTGASGSPGPGAIAQHPTLGLASQLHLARNGKFTLCGVGIAYHAGVGSWSGIAKNSANQVTIGIEAENSGSEGWSSAQYNAYVTGVAAILNRLKVGSSRCIGHKEWGAVQGKWDPGGVDMGRFRSEIGAAQAGSSAPVVNMINLCATENPWVGARLQDAETPIGADGKGRLVAFENAHIYWSANTGAHAVPHADPVLGGDKSGLFEAYRDRGFELGELGYPVRGFSPISTDSFDGAVQAFEGGILYRRDGFGGAVVKGVIGQRWALEGYEQGELGWPLTDEISNGSGGVRQVFERGALDWDPSGAVKTYGASVTDLNVVNSDGFPVAADAVEVVAA